MISISAGEIQSLDYPVLINALKKAFSGKFEVPQRHHHDFPNPGHPDSSLLLMPAWNKEYLGVKLIMISPDNARYDLPSIQGSYNLFRIKDGELLAQADAKALTTKRTAATSALASGFLSRTDSEVMLMVGTGALAPELIRAHCSVRSFKSVLIWGRNLEKARKVRNQLSGEIQIEVVKDLDRAVRTADLISVATLTVDPLIKGLSLKEGCHLDLVGAYRRDMRESDDAALLRSEIFVDTFEGATSESGELTIPLKSGVIHREDLEADLHSLCSGKHGGRSSESAITLFKSCGHAMEDLVAAQIIYQKLRS